MIADAAWNVDEGKWAFFLGVEGYGSAEAIHFALEAISWGFIGDIKLDETDRLAKVSPKRKRKGFM